MNQYTFRLTFIDGGTLTTTVSAVTRFVAEMSLSEIYNNIRYCDFISMQS